MHKSREEVSANARRVRGRQLLKASRRAEQDSNVQRKRERVEERRSLKKRRVGDGDDTLDEAPRAAGANGGDSD